MPLLKRCFFYHQQEHQEETWFYLARDTDTDRLFIIHEWVDRVSSGSLPIELADFLARSGNYAKRDLLKLIGTLVEETP